MSNLSDKEIDRLSREAADSYEPDVTSLSWTRLEQKLVEQMPERPPDGFSFGRISPYIWGPAVVLLAGISYYFIKSNSYSQLSTRTIEPLSQTSKIHTTDSARSTAHVVIADSLSSVQKSSLSGTEHSTVSGPADVSTFPPRSDISKHSESASPVSGKQNTHLQSVDESSTTNNGSTKSSAQGNESKKIIPSAVLSDEVVSSHGMSSTSGGTASNSTVGNKLPAEPSSSGGSTETGDLTSGVILVSSSNSVNGSSPGEVSKYELPQIISTGIGVGAVKGNDSLLNRPNSQKSPVIQKSVHINRSLNIGFTFGTDYTDAGGISNNQLSNNIGITLGYYVTNKLSVNTGLIYSNKFYWAPGHSQNRPTNTGIGGGISTYAWAPDIEYINGSCNMYELPLTLRYDFARNDKTKFFVNVGASSYFLLKQTNIYFIHNGSGRPAAWLSKDESQSNYWFGMGDLSFGLETDIGKGFSFQAEPFFRIPFQKMGVENLKMYSYGFMLSFRYAPVLSRIKK